MKEILDAGGLMPWVARSLAAGDPVAVGGRQGARAPAVSPDEPPQADWRLD
jgi:hypothetical protein